MTKMLRLSFLAAFLHIVGKYLVFSKYQKQSSRIDTMYCIVFCSMGILGGGEEGVSLPLFVHPGIVQCCDCLIKISLLLTIVKNKLNY